MIETMRLFIALELPDPVREALGAAQDSLRAKAPKDAVRWVRTEGIHVTLKFLGETPALRQQTITGALGQALAGRAALNFYASDLGCFPNTKRPRVIWIGLGGDLDALDAVVHSVESALAELGFDREDRPFSPHLTLGRVRQDARQMDIAALGNLIKGTKIGEIARWTAASVSLMSSDLRPDGAHYTCLASIPLVKPK